jgi:hypothetical protein
MPAAGPAAGLRPVARQLVAGLAIAALLLSSVSALASTFTDLEGVRASSAENTIMQRGYHAHHSSPAPNGRYTYWWNNLSKSCIRTFTSDGVIAATKTVSGADCGWYGGATNNSSSNSGGNKDAAAAAAVAAAALIGVAALTHKSHHREDQEYQDPQGYGDFEIGYRDGLYNHSYQNRGRSSTYDQGYRAGVQEREEHSSYRRNDRYADSSGGRGYGGGAQPAQFNDLVGSRAAGVETELQSRGFRNVDGFESGRNGKGTIWWNGRTRQCLQMITVDGRADSIEDIQTHQYCR